MPDSDTRHDSVPDAMDMLAAVMNARLALEYWIREVAVNAPEAEWAKAGAWRSAHECETLRWVETHLRKEVEAPHA